MSGSSAPWDTDRHLDSEVVHAFLRDALPGVDATGLRWAGRGWDFDVYRAGDRAFRFPRRAEYSGSWRWEPHLLDRVAPVLAPLGVRVPKVERTLPASALFPYPVMTYRWIEGRALPSDGSITAGPTLRALGAALRAVHRIDPDSLVRAGVPQEVWSVYDRVREAKGDLPELDRVVDPDDPDLRPAMRWLSRLTPDTLPRTEHVPVRLLHGDVVADHVLVDESGRLVGLIDWSDAMVEDPANDFVSIAAEWGSAGLDAALDGYGEDDPDFRARIAFMARATSLHWARDAILQGRDLTTERRCVRNAFALPIGD